MDCIEDGVLLGDISGTVTGGATLVDGRRGKALYTNGVDQWVDLGNHRNKCFGNLEICSYGYVISFWLKTTPGSNQRHYVNSGGHTSRSVGITVYKSGDTLNAMFRTTNQLWCILGLGYSDQTWYQMTATWTFSSELRIYFNGSRVGDLVNPENITSNRNPVHDITQDLCVSSTFATRFRY